MSYYSFNVSNGNPPGFNWWQQIGGGDTNIQLNTAAGATGINAISPTDNRLKLLLGNDAFAQEIAGFAGLDTVNDWLSGVGINILTAPVDTPVPQFFWRNLTNNIQLHVVVSPNNEVISLRFDQGAAFITIDVSATGIQIASSAAGGNIISITPAGAITMLLPTTPGASGTLYNGGGFVRVAP
jgi:hypothetical protein